MQGVDGGGDDRDPLGFVLLDMRLKVSQLLTTEGSPVTAIEEDNGPMALKVVGDGQSASVYQVPCHAWEGIARVELSRLAEPRQETVP